MRIAVVGFGFMGVVHAKNIIASDSMELCGIVDNREGDIFANIEKTGNHGDLGLPVERLKNTPVFKTMVECVEWVKPDAVSICVPLFLHYRLAKEALELGLDVLLEKPFCQDVVEGKELVELAEAQKRILMVAHCVRFDPAWIFLNECVKDKRYGDLRLLTTTRMAGEPTWGVWRDEKIKRTCGGSLLDLLIHDIDFASYCLGESSNMKVNLKNDEYWEIAFDYDKSSAVVSVKGGFLHRNSPFASEYAATFEHGSVRFSSHEPNVVHCGTDSGVETVPIEGDAYFNELAYFAHCVATRSRPERCLPEDSLRTIGICERIGMMANRTGRHSCS